MSSFEKMSSEWVERKAEILAIYQAKVFDLVTADLFAITGDDEILALAESLSKKPT